MAQEENILWMTSDGAIGSVSESVIGRAAREKYERQLNRHITSMIQDVAYVAQRTLDHTFIVTTDEDGAATAALADDELIIYPPLGEWGGAMDSLFDVVGTPPSGASLLLEEATIDEFVARYTINPENILINPSDSCCACAYQLLDEFNPSLAGKRYRSLRENVNKARNHGVYMAEEFSTDMLASPKVQSRLLLHWLSSKRSVNGSEYDEKNMHRALEQHLMKIKSLESHPRLRPFAAYRDGGDEQEKQEIVALALVLQYERFASIEYSVSTREHCASDFLITNVMRTLKEEGVERLERGVLNSQSRTLREHKERYALLHKQEFLLARPACTYNYSAPLRRLRRLIDAQEE